MKRKNERIFAGFLAAAMLMASNAYAQQDGRSEGEPIRPPRSEAGLFLEPMIFAERNNTEIKTSQLPIISDNTSGRTQGPGLGLRFGGHVNETFFLAADARYSQTDFSDSSYQSAKSTGYNYGVTAGAQTPYYGVRLWGTALLGGAMDPAAGAQGFDVKFDDAKGYRVGAGVHVASVALNLEYQDLTFDKSTIQSVGILNVDRQTGVDFTEKGLVLSVGFPIEL
ncbi:MAG: hypothetical protein KF865_09005 [Bdellovibrionaceae bacterium]|nr:hypothetical protein [Pseudobdellovibrionaceae bacterium]